eukprot:TRINITY_DN2449_c0_g1_i1.p2 TRINITY_DN2449_c0_g1~~TRINITY_DN2449_c0_g1_i1.p2  ORF type:complete len:232 (+),score=42.79 TRINITY_DN2449_c0_g1_i1:102-797(+)
MKALVASSVFAAIVFPKLAPGVRVKDEDSAYHAEDIARLRARAAASRAAALETAEVEDTDYWGFGEDGLWPGYFSHEDGTNVDSHMDADDDQSHEHDRDDLHDGHHPYDHHNFDEHGRRVGRTDYGEYADGDSLLEEEMASRPHSLMQTADQTADADTDYWGFGEDGLWPGYFSHEDGTNVDSHMDADDDQSHEHDRDDLHDGHHPYDHHNFDEHGRRVGRTDYGEYADGD